MIFHFEYRGALHRAHASDAVEREEERRISTEQPTFTEEEYTERLEHCLGRFTYKEFEIHHLLSAGAQDM